ncbi:2-phosphosulfolactate phosphatase [Actinomycetes bacterium M1A6_2h]
MVVDVLSFTTTLSVAADAGITVLPYRWHESAAEYAVANDAALAVGRSEAKAGQISLSPGTVRRASPPARLVLPSPNGSTISHELGVCVGASLRNAAAVAEDIESDAVPGRTVSIVAAGEKWPDGSLRPCAEDLWGAGAVISHLVDLGFAGPLSPEARVAADAWNSVSATIRTALRDCASGRELIAMGFADDVEVAAEVGESDSVPVLRDGAFSGNRT